MNEIQESQKNKLRYEYLKKRDKLEPCLRYTYSNMILSNIKKMKEFKDFDKDGLDLMDKCLQMDPEKRITIREMLNHPLIVKYKEAEGINNDNVE